MIHSRIFCLTHVDPLLNSHQSNIPPTTRTHTQSQVYHGHNRTHVLIRHRYDSLRCHVQIGTKFRIPILSQLSKQTVTAGVKRSVKADVGSTITYSHTYVFSEGAHIYLYIYICPICINEYANSWWHTTFISPPSSAAARASSVVGDSAQMRLTSKTRNRITYFPASRYSAKCTYHTSAHQGENVLSSAKSIEWIQLSLGLPLGSIIS